MSGSNPVSLTIDQDTVKSVLNASIQAAIVAQFASNPGFLDSLVQAAVNTKVDENGRMNSTHWNNTHSLIEVLASQAIHTAAKAAMAEWVEENKPAILAAIKKSLNSSKVDLVKRFVDAAEKSLAPNFEVSCSLKLSTDRR